jgi:hypothetical protein
MAVPPGRLGIPCSAVTRSRSCRSVRASALRLSEGSRGVGFRAVVDDASHEPVTGWAAFLTGAELWPAMGDHGPGFGAERGGIENEPGPNLAVVGRTQVWSGERVLQGPE